MGVGDVAFRPRSDHQNHKAPCRAITAQQGEGSLYVYEKITCIGNVGRVTQNSNKVKKKKGCDLTPPDF